MTAPAKATPLDYFASRLRGRAKIALASDSEYDEFVIVENADDAKALCTLLARCERLEAALRELLDAELSVMPSFEAGKDAQDAWADRRAAARNDARAALDVPK